MLIAINAAIFIAQLAAGGGATSFDGGGSLFTEGALCGNAVGSGGSCGFPPLATDGGEWWRIVSAGFLHGGFIHLALNMFVLFILGRLVEPAIGTRRMLMIYFVSLIAGSLGALLLSDPRQFTVGASGAIYGLFAATLLIARDRGFDQVVTQLGFWLVLNLVLTFSIPDISIGGHLGGLVGGAAGGARRARRRAPRGRRQPGRDGDRDRDAGNARARLLRGGRARRRRRDRQRAVGARLPAPLGIVGAR